MNNYCVITTINLPTKAVEILYEKFGEKLLIVTDEKTPRGWLYKNVPVISGDGAYAPKNHYARKNLGYMEAIRAGADLIYDTDDDNVPNENWGLRFKETKASKSFGEGWFNVYEPMTVQRIWPRGFPLSKLQEGKYSFGAKEPVVSSIQQGLSDGEADVDAIHRLVFNKKTNFNYDRSIYLQKNTWCPFNSQSTWFFPDAYPLMYLPVTATFRMCDIWRSFVAQKCLWSLDQGVTFHSPSEVFQERNEHDLMKDFADEVPGYLHNEKIIELFDKMQLNRGIDQVCRNLYVCYNALVANNFLPKKEMASVEAWINDYENIVANL